MCMDSVRVGIARGSGVRGRARPWKAARRRKDVVYLFFRRVLGSTRLEAGLYRNNKPTEMQIRYDRA
jgi:hypothetical protein